MVTKTKGQGEASENALIIAKRYTQVEKFMGTALTCLSNVLSILSF